MDRIAQLMELADVYAEALAREPAAPDGETHAKAVAAGAPRESARLALEQGLRDAVADAARDVIRDYQASGDEDLDKLVRRAVHDLALQFGAYVDPEA